VLRGVLKTRWYLGLMNAETYRRVANVRAKTLPAGRPLETAEVRAPPSGPPPAAATPQSSTAPACAGPNCAASTSPAKARSRHA